MAPSSPTVARWELALRIKARRVEGGVSVKTITDHLGFSRNFWSAVENQRSLLADDKLERLLELLSFDTNTADELRELARASRQRGWLTEHESGIEDEDLRRLYGLEAGAIGVRSYEVNLVTGLLQNEEYANALISTDPAVSSVQVRQLLDIRMARQERFYSRKPAQLTALMSQAALEQQTGGSNGPGVLRRQLCHLVDMKERFRDAVDIRVLPFSAGMGGLVGASTFYLLDFSSSHLPTVAWQEIGLARGFVEDTKPHEHLLVSYLRALTLALSTEDSLSLIEQQADHLKA